MANRKYEKYVITKTPECPMYPRSKENNEYYNSWANTLWINDGLNGAVKDAFYVDCILIWDKKWPDNTSHYHDFDEYLIFIGTDPKNPSDLGGEVELWLGDEKYIITKNTAVFVPKKLEHCPLKFHKVTRPFIFIRTGNTTKDLQPQTHHAGE